MSNLLYKGFTPTLRAGDLFTMTVPVRRPWWQFWRPKWSMEKRTYRVVEGGHS